MKPIGVENNSRRFWFAFGFYVPIAQILTCGMIWEMQHPQPNTSMVLIVSWLGRFAFIPFMTLFLSSLFGPMVAAIKLSRWFLLLLLTFAGLYVYLLSGGH